MIRALGLLPALALGVALLAPWLPEDRFWWAALLAAGLPYLTLLVLLGFPWWRRWPAISPGYLLLVGLAGLRMAFFPSRPEVLPERSATLDILSYNYYVRAPWDAREMDGILQLVLRLAPDVVAIQERSAYFQGREKPPEVGRDLWAAVDSGGLHLTWPARLVRSRLFVHPVFTRPPVEVVEVTQHELPLEVGKGRPEWVTRLVFRWQGREAVLYNVHLRSFGEDKPWIKGCVLEVRCWAAFLQEVRQAYRQRAREVRALRAMLDRETRPVILVGDFNSTPYNWAYRVLKGHLQDAYRLRGRWPGFTYHRKYPLVRIDYILVDPAFQVVEAHVLPEGFSDHRPLFARLTWKEPMER